MVYQLGDTRVNYEIETRDAEFLKVSTNTFGALRFKTADEDEAVKKYADQISTDNQSFTAAEARKLPGFKVIMVKDKQRCLRKTLQQKDSTASSRESPTP